MYTSEMLLTTVVTTISIGNLLIVIQWNPDLKYISMKHDLQLYIK